MQHREVITTKLERIEGAISRLQSLLSRGGSSTDFKNVIEETKYLVQEVKDYIQREPRTPNEFK